jgi:hypothetical protein
LERGYAVDKQDAVQVVDFMLDGPGHDPFRVFNRVLFSVYVKRFHGDGFRALDLEPDRGNTQASLLVIDCFFGETNNFRIDQDIWILLAGRGIDDRNPDRLTDLVRGKATPSFSRMVTDISSTKRLSASSKTVTGLAVFRNTGSP